MGHIKIKLIIVFLCNFFFCSCQEKSNKVIDNENSKNQIINNWKKDSLGCLGLRSLDLAKKIIEDNNLLGCSKENFEDFFGAPNDLIINEEKIALIYYIEARCKNDKLVNGADKCWIQFSFVRNKLSSVPKVSACE